MHYSAVSYWTPGWVIPRGRLREPFPRRLRRYRPEVYAPPPAPFTPVIAIRLTSESFTQPDASTESFTQPASLDGMFAQPDMLEESFVT